MGLKKNEILLVGSPLEIVLVEEKDGSLTTIIGGKNYVDLPNNLKGKKISHNHPTNSPFSLEDMKVFIEGQLSEIRVITKDGFIYSIRNPKKTKLDFTEIKKSYDKFYDEAKKLSDKKVEKGLIKESDIKKEIIRIQWELIAKEKGFLYEQKKW
ncbi:MAG: hypothetical protein SFU98_02340 [Leptospiraceae bacterium]|nr:hypothetical protein [Leptospiraceae bacterium]